jgi:osmotically-inducible protein OsmY
MKRINTLLVAVCATALSLGVAVAAENDPHGNVAARDAEDTGKNVRDRDGDTQTPDKQSNDEGDLEITRRLRREITADDSLSTNAHNVKIITENGIVTLRGPVDSAKEKAAIAAKAQKVQGVKRVENQLEIAG